MLWSLRFKMGPTPAHGSIYTDKCIPWFNGRKIHSPGSEFHSMDFGLYAHHFTSIALFVGHNEIENGIPPVNSFMCSCLTISFGILRNSVCYSVDPH